LPKRPNDFDAFFANTPDERKPVVTELRKLVRRVAPNLVEQMKYGMPQYTKEKHTVVYIMPTTDHVNLGFYDGVELDDPKKLLEGTGKRLRHVKVRTVQAARSPALRAFVEDAVRVRKKIGRPPKRW
jgi:hypothetical protein